MNDKRAHLRKSVEAEAWMAELSGDDWTPVRMLDISVGGAALIAAEPMPNSATRMLRFSLPGNPELLVFTARVANCSAHSFLAGYRIGVEFIRRENHTIEAIAKFIENSAG